MAKNAPNSLLDLSCTYYASPSTPLAILELPLQSLIIYGAADNVILLDSANLGLVTTLAFWEPFPGLFGTHRKVTFLTVDQENKFVVASSEAQIVVWEWKDGVWGVHSTLSLQFPVASLDCKSGKLCASGQSIISLYSLNRQRDIPTWEKQWTVKFAESSQVLFSPSLTLIAARSQNTVRIIFTAKGRQIQLIQHPRPVTNITWRPSHKDELILYTVTSDSTLRIFFPVLDSPLHLQLHATIDPYSFLSSPLSAEAGSPVFWLDKDVLRSSMLASLEAPLEQRKNEAEGQRKRVEEICYEGWDLFARVLEDGTVVIRAIANLDRRPPTLLKQFTLLTSHPGAFPTPPKQFLLLKSSLDAILTCDLPLVTYRVDPLPFFDACPDGLQPLARGLEHSENDDATIVRFVRTPDGSAVALARENGKGEIWKVKKNADGLERGVEWTSDSVVAAFDGGQTVASYSSALEALIITRTSFPQVTIPMKPLVSLFSLPANNEHTCLIGITSNSLIHRVHVTHTSPPRVTLESQATLPLPKPPHIILPVDPMAWSTQKAKTRAADDVLLSVSVEGELAFWTLDISGWKCTGNVRTGRTGIVMANCSSAKKSVLVVTHEAGQEMTIWDSKVSEFSSGLEYRQIFSQTETINDLDWTSTSSSHSILAVGFAHYIVLLCQQRMTYFEQEPSWQILGKVDIRHLTPHPIADSIWLTGGSLLLGAGHQMFYFGQQAEHLFDIVAKQNAPLDDYHPQMLLQCLLWDKVEFVKDVIVGLALSLSQGIASFRYQNMPVQRFLEYDSGPTKESAKNRAQYSLLFHETTPKAEEDDGGVFSSALVNRLVETLERESLPGLTANEQAHLIILIQATLEVENQRRSLDSNGLRYCISMDSFYLLNRRLDSPGQTPGSQAIRTPHRDKIRYRDIVWAFHSESQEILLSSSTAACGGKMMWSDARALGIFLWLNSHETLKSQMEVIARNHYMAGDDRDPTSCCLFYFALGKVRLVHGLWKQASWHKEQDVMLKFLANDFSQPRWKTAALKNAFALLGKRRYEYAAAFFLLGGCLDDAVNVCLKQLDDFQLAVALARVVEAGDDGPVLRNLLKTTVIPLAFREGNRWLGSWAFWMLRRRDLAVRILVTALDVMAVTLGPDMPVADVGDPHYDDPSLALLFSQLKNKSLQTAKGTSEISGQTEFNFVIQIAGVFCRMGCHALALHLVRSWSFDRPALAPLVPVRQLDDPHLLSSPRSPQIPGPELDQQMPLSPITPRRRSMRPFWLESRRRSSVIIDMDFPITRENSPSLEPTPTTRIVSGSEFAKNITLANSKVEATEEGNPATSSTLLPIQEHGTTDRVGLGNLIQTAKRDVKVPEFDMNAFF